MMMGLGLRQVLRGLVAGTRNPHGSGASAPSTAPTNWSLNGSGGLTWTVVGSGVGYVDLRCSGTASGTAVPSIMCESTTYTIAAAGETWVGLADVQLVAGSWNITGTIESGERNSSGSALTATSVAITPAATAKSYSVSRLFNQGTVARATNVMRFSAPNATVVDFTIRIRGMTICKAGPQQ